jgi:uncharacterized integral membrane protein
MVREGVRWVVTALAIGFGIVAVVDIYFELTDSRSISLRLQTWSRRYPLYAGMLVFLVGALLAHFIINRDI